MVESMIGAGTSPDARPSAARPDVVMDGTPNVLVGGTGIPQVHKRSLWGGLNAPVFSLTKPTPPVATSPPKRGSPQKRGSRSRPMSPSKVASTSLLAPPFVAHTPAHSPAPPSPTIHAPAASMMPKPISSTTGGFSIGTARSTGGPGLPATHCTPAPTHPMPSQPSTALPLHTAGSGPAPPQAPPQQVQLAPGPSSPLITLSEDALTKLLQSFQASLVPPQLAFSTHASTPTVGSSKISLSGASASGFRARNFCRKKPVYLQKEGKGYSREGRFFCFAFNLPKGCNKGLGADACLFVHRCALCGANHSAQDCTVY
ncbi:hypothetical protein DFH07DRAFT_79210 [Mycena maculata]|uniref:Uncharacterized protein n=1 Tax=Mycena maculata TaxID=230809 RepID=A0AAD7MZH1_9AGAR|nr:hypothetical protein DFH07DRAFT_79210 [Mycena maculata]